MAVMGAVVVKIGFTGTQVGMTFYQKEALRELLRDHCEEGFLEFHHGDCIGADAEAVDIASTEGYYIYCHPPINETKRAFKHAYVTYEAKKYLDRNHDIVDVCDLLVGCPKERTEQLRSGTWATLRYARKTGKTYEILWPN